MCVDKDPMIDGLTPDKVVNDIDEAIILSGGIGRFQVWSFFVIVMGMVCGAFWLYSLQYFTKIPEEYYCKDTASSDWVTCDHDQACSESTYSFKPDKTAEGYLQNWAEQLDIYCLDKFKSGLLGAMFFVGTFTGSFVLPRASDIYGRKPLTLLGLVIYFSVVTSAFFVKNVYLMYFLIFMGGISETGRYYVAYVYIIEMMPKQN